MEYDNSFTYFGGSSAVSAALYRRSPTSYNPFQISGKCPASHERAAGATRLKCGAKTLIGARFSVQNRAAFGLNFRS